MNLLEDALKPHLNREVAAWLNHHDLKVLTGRLIEVNPDHVVIRTGGDQTYIVPWAGLVALRPAQ